MQNSQLDRLLKLAKRTGDRLIVTSNDGAEPVVILPLAEYEAMLDLRTFRQGREDYDHEVGVDGDAERRPVGEDFAVDPVVNPIRDDEEGDFDPVALERQVMAAMVQEEPEVVPVVEPTAETPAEPELQETQRKPITRKVNPADDGGEERFYLEAV